MDRLVDSIDNVGESSLYSLRTDNANFLQRREVLRRLLCEARHFRKWIRDPLENILNRWLRIIGRTKFVLEFIDVDDIMNIPHRFSVWGKSQVSPHSGKEPGTLQNVSDTR